MARSPWIWQGQDARLLCTGSLLDSNGNPISTGGGDVTIQTDAGTYPVGTTLIFAGGTHFTFTGNSGTDTTTLTSDATNANTVSTIVARDSSGNFSAGSITASLLGIAYKTSQSISGTAIDWSTGDIFYKTISTNTTFTFSNAVDGMKITVIITAGSGNTVTWPTVKWQNGSPPTQTSSGTDVYSFIKYNSTLIVGSYIPAVS
jgi:hypothetical protein